MVNENNELLEFAFLQRALSRGDLDFIRENGWRGFDDEPPETYVIRKREIAIKKAICV